MNKWKIAFWTCLVLLVMVLSCSVYTVIDQAVAIGYEKVSHTETENDLDDLIKLINETDLSKKEVSETLKTHSLAEFMNFNSDTISMMRISLIFENDRLTEISKNW